MNRVGMEVQSNVLETASAYIIRVDVPSTPETLQYKVTLTRLIVRGNLAVANTEDKASVHSRKSVSTSRRGMIKHVSLLTYRHGLPIYVIL
jgi:hypothetical protein